MRASLLFAILALAACGAPEAGRVPVGLEIRSQALTGDESLQFVFLHPTDDTGAEVSCAQATSTCVVDQQHLRTVALEVDGKTQRYYRVPLDVAAAQGEGQGIALPGIPPGRSYRLVVELVDTADGDNRVGVGCVPIEQVIAGDNPALSTPIEVLETTAPCNAGF